MTKLETSFTINGTVVEFEEDLGSGYKVYLENRSDYGITKYIVRDNKVIFSIYAEADGDEMAHISELNINLMG